MLSRSGRRQAVAATALLLAGGLVALADSAPAAAAEPCHGQMPTIVATANNQSITGTDGPDVISTAGFEMVTIDARGGDDLVCGWAVVDGGDGNDVIDGAKLARGGPGDDTLLLASPTLDVGTIEAHGGTGDDTFTVSSAPGHWQAFAYGEEGDDRFETFGAVDAGLDGGAGDDSFVHTGTAGFGRTVFSPGAGDDHVEAPGATDERDTISYADLSLLQGPGVTIDVPASTVDGDATGHDTFVGEFDFVGSFGPDVFRGGPGEDHFDGAGRARDVVDGFGGDDVLSGTRSVIRGGPGDDRLTGEGGRVLGGSGDDVLHGMSGGVVRGGPGRDQISTYRSTEKGEIPIARFRLFGGPGNDVIGVSDLDGDTRLERCTSPKRCLFVVHGGPGRDRLSFEDVRGQPVWHRGTATWPRGGRARYSGIERFL